MPDIARSMEQLLRYEGDVEGTFQLSFEVEYDYFGQLKTHELKRGGSKASAAPARRPSPCCQVETKHTWGVRGTQLVAGL